MIDRLTNLNPDQRITIEEALKRLKEMGDDTKNEDIILNQYITKLKERIESNRSSISLNEDILITKELYIELKITGRDPEKYKDQKIEDLFKRIDRFLAGNIAEQQVMAIFGSAGSGKSIALQLKFIEVVHKWKKGQPLPIYFNLANGIDLTTLINSMNTELGTNLKLQELKNDVHLYIDSFDEGFEFETKRETLIREYITELKNSNVKILITCRSDYLESDSNHSWFTPQINAFDKLVIRYVAPMSYKSAESSSWEEEQKKEPKHKEKDSEEYDLSRYEEYLEALQGMLAKVTVMQQQGLIDATTALKLAMEARLMLEAKYQIKKPIWKERKNDENDAEDKASDQNWEDLDSEENGSDEENASNQNSKERAGKEDSRWKRNVVRYLKRKNPKINQKELKTNLERMAMMNLDKFMETGLMFHIVMELLPELLADDSQFRSRSKQEIYLKYVTKYQKEELEKLTEEQKIQVTEKTKFISTSQEKEFSLIKAIKDLGKYLAVQLHLGGKFRLDQEAPVFQAIGYERTIHFKKKVLWHILKLLPLKIESKYGSNSNKIKNQEVKLGFIHNAIKNSYLLDAIQEEMFTQNGNSQTLASKSIIADSELVKFIADAVRHDEVLKNYLRKAIDSSRSEKRDSAAIYAANCITILVSARHSFQCQDLSNIKIKGANLRNGIFSGADFTGADLSHTDLENVQGNNATFRKTNLAGAKLGVLPDLQGHTSPVRSVCFSSDGQFIASGSSDKTVKVWEVHTSKCVVTLEGHTEEIWSVSFSGDGKYLGSGSEDKTVKIWEVQMNKCLATLAGHTGKIWGVSFSADGKYIASGSQDKVVRSGKHRRRNVWLLLKVTQTES